MDANDRANELYWGSDQSVNQIADDLDLSKGALYEMIRPLPSGRSCPICGVEVVFSNRTAKERGRVDCPACEWGGQVSDADTGDSGAHDASTGVDGARDRASDAGIAPPRIEGVEPVDEIYPMDAFDTPRPLPASAARDISDVRRLAAGGALLGAAVGLALVIWARRR